MRSVSTPMILLALCAPAPADERPATAGTAQAPASAPAVERAIERATRWLQAHPADVREGEIIEVVEEIMFFYALSRQRPADTERAGHLREIGERHEALAAFTAEAGRSGPASPPYLQGTWAALTYPPLAHIVASLGMDASIYRGIIDSLVASHPQLYPPREAMRLWITVYMARLGYETPTPAGVLLAASALRQDPDSHRLLERLSDASRTPGDRQATIQLIYDITHEIIAVTDFGALPPPPAMDADRDHYARLLDQALIWAIDNAALDVLAELSFCAHLLDLSDLPSADRAIALILASQQEDGSFGVTNPDRREGRRHGVLTGLLALQTLGADRGTPP